MKKQKEGGKGAVDIPQAILDQGDQSVASLLRFLIQIVLQNFGPEG